MTTTPPTTPPPTGRAGVVGPVAELLTERCGASVTLDPRTPHAKPHFPHCGFHPDPPRTPSRRARARPRARGYRTQTAPRSDGWHLYYGHPGLVVPCSAGRLGPGVDVRGDGGYVVAPPSLHPRTGRPYRWTASYPLAEMPSPLVTACLPPPAPPVTSAGPATTRAAEGISCPDRLLAALLDAVARAPEGRRRATLYGSARGVARMVAAGAVAVDDAVAALTDAGRTAQQTERETRSAIAGGFRAEGVAW